MNKLKDILESKLSQNTILEKLIIISHQQVDEKLVINKHSKVKNSCVESLEELAEKYDFRGPVRNNENNDIKYKLPKNISKKYNDYMNSGNALVNIQKFIKDNNLLDDKQYEVDIFLNANDKTGNSCSNWITLYDNKVFEIVASIIYNPDSMYNLDSNIIEFYFSKYCLNHELAGLKETCAKIVDFILQYEKS